MREVSFLNESMRKVFTEANISHSGSRIKSLEKICLKIEGVKNTNQDVLIRLYIVVAEGKDNIML